MYDDIKKLVLEKRQELMKNKGIIIIGPVPNEKIDEVHEVVDEYENIDSFNISGSKIVLRYKAQKQRLDYGAIIRDGQDAFRNEDYDEAIAQFSKILETARYPKAFVFGKIGLSYMKKLETEKAIDYLTIATELGKDEERYDMDYTSLIDKLQRGLRKSKENDQDMFKKVVRMEEPKKGQQTDLDKMNAIIKYVVDNNLDIEQAGIALNYSEEERDIAKLLYAVEFFKRGDMKYGERYFQNVANTPHKSEKVIDMYERIKERKKFYQYQFDMQKEKTPVLVKPGKRLTKQLHKTY